MSAYSTTNITRNAAKKAIINYFLGESCDEILEKTLDELVLSKRLRKTRIVEGGEENEDYLLD